MESSAQVPLADITEPNWLMQDRKYISCYMANYSCKDEALMQAVVDEFARQAVLCRNWRCWRQSYGSSRQTFNIRRV